MERQWFDFYERPKIIWLLKTKKKTIRVVGSRIQNKSQK